MPSAELRNSAQKDDEPKTASLLSRIKRSMSLTSESAAFAIYAKNDNQRKSTFYLTDPINVDICDNSIEEETGNKISEEMSQEKIGSPSDTNRNLKKSKLSRPKSPPPPVPTVLGKLIFFKFPDWNVIPEISYQILLLFLNPV